MPVRCSPVVMRRPCCPSDFIALRDRNTQISTMWPGITTMSTPSLANSLCHKMLWLDFFSQINRVYCWDTESLTCTTCTNKDTHFIQHKLGSCDAWFVDTNPVSKQSGWTCDVYHTGTYGGWLLEANWIISQIVPILADSNLKITHEICKIIFS